MNIVEASNMFYGLLTADSDLMAALGGRVYNGKRSDGRETEECIVVNTPWSDHTTPQEGYSNINIHVPDIPVTIDGVEQMQPDTHRISALTNLVMAVLESATVEGVSWERPQETLIQEAAHGEHYNNLRIEWINCNK